MPFDHTPPSCSLSHRFKEAQVPWTWDILSELRAASLRLLHAYLSTVLLHCERAGLQLPPPSPPGAHVRPPVVLPPCAEPPSSGLVKMLDAAVTFAFKHHQCECWRERTWYG